MHVGNEPCTPVDMVIGGEPGVSTIEVVELRSNPAFPGVAGHSELTDNLGRLEENDYCWGPII